MPISIGIDACKRIGAKVIIYENICHDMMLDPEISLCTIIACEALILYALLILRDKRADMFLILSLLETIPLQEKQKNL